MTAKYEYKTMTFFIGYDKVFMKNEHVVNGAKIDKELDSVLNQAANDGWRTVSINHTQNISDLMIIALFEREIQY